MNRLIKRFITSAEMYVAYFFRNTIDLLFARQDISTPPTRLMFDGPRDRRDTLIFKRDGEEFLRDCVALCDLKANETILDVGCGIGRNAIPLTKYLDEKGRYEGFDAVKLGIDWCKRKISTKHPHFRFEWVDIFNGCYNRSGRYNAADYRFPFDDEVFDLAVVFSVFTHMLPREVENYYSEISRVLKRNGRCLVTFFLRNEESLNLVSTKKSALDFKYDMGNYHSINPDTPETAVCYDERFILHVYEKYGLSVKSPIHYGSWCGRTEFRGYQDMVVGRKI